MKTAALIVAGGEGKRFGSPLPKQFIKLNGKEIFIRSIELFYQSSLIDYVVLVMHPDWIARAVNILKNYGLKRVEVVAGGEYRQQSVYKGLNALTCYKPHKVMIHDAVRPLFDANQIEEILSYVEPGKGAVIAEKITDTIYQAEDAILSKVLDRRKLWKAQTPQCFIFEEILNAHEKALNDNFLDATDDATLYMKYGGTVTLLSSRSPNFKITAQTDLQIAESYLKKLEE